MKRGVGLRVHTRNWALYGALSRIFPKFHPRNSTPFYFSLCLHFLPGGSICLALKDSVGLSVALHDAAGGGLFDLEEACGQGDGEVFLFNQPNELESHLGREGGT